MKSKRLWFTAMVAGVGFLLATLPAQGQLEPAAQAEMDRLHQSPGLAGNLIYRGDTYAQRTSAGKPLFHYERRVSHTANGLLATHLTSDPAGNLIIVETATVSSTYQLRHLHIVDSQSDYSGSVTISNNGHSLEYQLNEKAKTSHASEEVSEDVVSGASLFGYILNKWDQLRSGEVIKVRMIVLRDKTTYGFDLRFEQQRDQQISFSVTPSHFFIRQLVAPLHVVFDATTKKPVRYEGRVPPMEMVSGKLKELDARVIYTAVSASYQ